MERVIEEEIEQQRQAWKERYDRDYERLSQNIAALEDISGAEWASKAFLELRNHLQVLDVLTEKVFTLSAALKATQVRLVVAEAELAQLEQGRQKQV
jgi:crotonobetainyl-CoA:carnitine CoA-transferase CaiB-like acyl-CoA transferase